MSKNYRVSPCMIRGIYFSRKKAEVVYFFYCSIFTNGKPVVLSVCLQASYLLHPHSSSWSIKCQSQFLRERNFVPKREIVKDFVTRIAVGQWHCGWSFKALAHLKSNGLWVWALAQRNIDNVLPSDHSSKVVALSRAQSVFCFSGQFMIWTDSLQGICNKVIICPKRGLLQLGAHFKLKRKGILYNFLSEHTRTHIWCIRITRRN